MKTVLLAGALMFSSSLMATSNIPLDQQLGEFTVEEIFTQTSNKNRSRLNRDNRSPRNGSLDNDYAGNDFPGSNFPGNDFPPGSDFPGNGFPGNRNPNPRRGNGQGHYNDPSNSTFDDRIQQTGKVIQVARDMVALGEAVYQLARKGKPTNVTSYAPISVVPRDPETGEYVDVFDLENFSIPVERSFVARVKDKNGREVVTFNYKVIYSFGGSYNGAGRYLTNVMIVPGSITTRFGWDFNATMSLSGIMNHGTRQNPVAGAMVAIKYQMNSWSTAFERNDTVHVTGNGQFTSLISP